MEQTIMDALITYGAMGVCLVYFIYKDFSTAKEQKKAIEENTKAMSEFTAVLNIIKDLIKK